jgi:NNP family nitrate/nitrite transporter-like MFS transporter
MSSTPLNQTDTKSLAEGSQRNPPEFLRSNLGPLFSLTSIFFINFLSRVVLAPLLVTLEKEFHLGHQEAGILIFIVTGGYSLSLFCSSFLSSRIIHRKTIFFSAMGMGFSLLVLSLSQNIWLLRLMLFLTGISAGIYLPSGIVTLTSLIKPQDWGKAIAVHELAPNIGFFAAPILAEVFLQWGSWRGLLALLGTASILLAVTFKAFGRGGEFLGQAPTIEVVRSMLKKPSMWIMMVFFGLGIGTSFGVYNMLPLYLEVERGISRGWANTLIALSRIAGIFIAFLAGWFVDRWGVKKTLTLVFLITGFLTFFLGAVTRDWLIPFVFFQPLVAVCFFPAGFTAISQIGPAGSRNVAVSFVVPLGFILGGGAVPVLIGWAGERGSFAWGIILVGIITMAGVPLVRGLKLTKRKNDAY